MILGRLPDLPVCSLLSSVILGKLPICTVLIYLSCVNLGRLPELSVLLHLSCVILGNFVSLITVYLYVFLLVFILPGTLCASWTFFDYFLFQVREVFSYYIFKYFVRSFLFLLLLGPLLFECWCI